MLESPAPRALKALLAKSGPQARWALKALLAKSDPSDLLEPKVLLVSRVLPARLELKALLALLAQQDQQGRTVLTGSLGL